MELPNKKYNIIYGNHYVGGRKMLCDLCTFYYFDIEFIYENRLEERCRNCKNHVKKG